MALNIVEQIDGPVRISNVLISVSDKTGLDYLVKGLVEINPNIKIYSTGGTHERIGTILGKSAKSVLFSVSELTGQPEMQGGLVKTLDFKIYLGLLSETYNEAHKRDLERTGAVAFDMVVVNLYPFKQTVADSAATVEQARTNIDIGGPCMIRAAAKNFLRVLSVTDPSDYRFLLGELKANQGVVSLKTRYEFARKAFRHTAEYDAAIADFLKSREFDSVVACYKINS